MATIPRKKKSRYGSGTKARQIKRLRDKHARLKLKLYHGKIIANKEARDKIRKQREEINKEIYQLMLQDREETILKLAQEFMRKSEIYRYFVTRKMNLITIFK
jgi:aminopeptidase C